jgi:hypothetical protein
MLRLWSGFLVVTLASVAGGIWLNTRTPSATPPPAVPPMVTVAPPATTLQLNQLFEPGSRLAPTALARSLDGKRVRLVGFMADLELPPKGALYLTPRPVKCDEAGGGTADLPPETVLVLVRSASTRELAHVPGPLEATGTFEVGNRTDEAGRSANFRLRLDEAPRPMSATTEGSGS